MSPAFIFTLAVVSVMGALCLYAMYLTKVTLGLTWRQMFADMWRMFRDVPRSMFKKDTWVMLVKVLTFRV